MSKTIYIQTDHSSAQLEYTVRYLNEHPLVQSHCTFQLFFSEDVEQSISYGGNPNKAYHIPRQHIFFNDEKLTRPTVNYYIHNSQEVHSVERNTRETPLPFVQSGKFAFDLLETIFFHVSRYEEYYAPPELHSVSGWLEETQHVLVQNGLEKIPVVDILIVQFLEALKVASVAIDTSYSLSHDIDIIYRFRPWWRLPRSIVGNIYHKRGISHFLKSLYAGIVTQTNKARDPYNTFPFLFRSEARCSKTIYLIAGGQTKFDRGYDINSVSLHGVLSMARQCGYEIGLHGSYCSGQNQGILAQELEILTQSSGSEIHKCRQHCLRWSWSTTPSFIAESGITNDSSMGYNKRIGFRCGTGFPYRLYDHAGATRYTFVETPLVFMESALIHESARTKRPIPQIAIEFLEVTNQNTHVEINWHNSNMDKTMWYGQELQDLYLQIITKLT